MAFPIAKYGFKEVLYLGILLLALCGITLHYFPPLSFIPLAAFLFVLAFFRDPERVPPSDDRAIVAPADGKITEIREIEKAEFIEGKALKIGIFMSLFNVHVNRAPTEGKVLFVEHRPGKFLNALNPDSSKENECSFMGLRDRAGTKIVVKQIAGVIARRIVCTAGSGDWLQKGQRFGMIKFGSRVEVFLPAGRSVDCKVRLGEKVKAGSTILGFWKENEA